MFILKLGMGVDGQTNEEEQTSIQQNESAQRYDSVVWTMTTPWRYEITFSTDRDSPKRIKEAAKVAARSENVISQTIKNEIGTTNAPSVAQPSIYWNQIQTIITASFKYESNTSYVSDYSQEYLHWHLDSTMSFTESSGNMPGDIFYNWLMLESESYQTHANVGIVYVWFSRFSESQVALVVTQVAKKSHHHLCYYIERWWYDYSLVNQA